MGNFALIAGGIAVAASIHLVRQMERVTVSFDRGRRRLTLERRLFWRRRRSQWSYDEIATIDIETWNDSDGPLWRPSIILKSHERIAMRASWSNDRQDALDIQERALALLDR